MEPTAYPAEEQSPSIQAVNKPTNDPTCAASNPEHSQVSTNTNSERHLLGSSQSEDKPLVNGKSYDASQLSEVDGPKWPTTIPSVWNLFVSAVERYPNNLAVASVYQRGEVLNLKNIPLDHHEYKTQPYLRWSYSEFAKGVLRLITALKKAGVKEGHLVFTFMHNCAEFSLIFWAAASLGCTISPIHPRNLLNKEEAAHIFSRAISSNSEKKAIVFVQNAEIARQVSELTSVHDVLTIVVDCEEHPKHGRALLDLMLDHEFEKDIVDLTEFQSSAVRWAVLLFTSGTTALPKGVILDAYRLDRWMEGRRQAVPLTEKDSALVVLPNNHAFWFLSELALRGCGGATVYPSPSFSPQVVPDIMSMEQCTQFPMPPTVVHAVTQICIARGIKFESLRVVSSGAAKMSVEFLRSCTQDLGAEGFEIMYGSTEGGVVCSTGIVTEVGEIVRDGDAAVGRPPVGAKLKVCAPGERVPLPRNEAGELHYASVTRCDGYVGGEYPEAFYTDDQGQDWFVTGDAATINDEGLVFIVGRIKDMIIRGGMNISPAAVEFVLNRTPATKDFNIQIVGKIDPVAGEVPIAVSQKIVTLDEASQIKNTVLTNMGPPYLPVEVLSLQQLGVDDFPKTALGKIQKGKLREIVHRFLEKSENSQEDPIDSMRSVSDAQAIHGSRMMEPVAQTEPSSKQTKRNGVINQPAHSKTDSGVSFAIAPVNDTNGDLINHDLIQKVQKVWKRTIGHEVDVDSQVSEYADSITLMRVQERFKRDVGAAIPLAEILEAKTVRAQVKLVEQYSAGKEFLNKTLDVADDLNTTTRRRPLTHHDIIHLADEPQWFSSTRAYISDQISRADFDWEDIREITPASDFTQVLTQADILNTSWSWKFAFLAKPGIDKNVLRRGIEVMLTNNPLLTSFLFSDRSAFGSDLALHVIPRSSPKLFDRVFRDYGNIATKEQFVKLVFEPYEYEMALLPGLLTQFLLFDVGDTGRSGTIMVAHHAPMDASYMQLIFDDLDKALGDAAVLSPHVSFKTWADSYHSLRTSHAANVAVKWHVGRLEDLSAFRSSVFPPLPRPHHYVTQYQHVQSVSDNGYHTSFHANGITNLRRKHPSIAAPVVVKAAWSLMNMHRNNTSCAIFSNLQADRRRFPFVPKCLELLSPAHTFEAGNVAGPTLQDVVNIVPLKSEESVLEFLYRIYEDQENLNVHAAAPLRSIMNQIGPINSEIMLDIFRSQIFNWTPGLGAMQTHNPNENYEPLASFIRPSLRLVINVDVGGADDETAFMQIKSPLFDMNGLRSIGYDVQDFVLWLCDERNWSTRMQSFKTALRTVTEGEEGRIASKAEHKEHIM